MNKSEASTRWLDEEHAYAVAIERGATLTRKRGDMSHAGAMTLAQELRDEGNVAVVMHVIGDQSYEVDRYPVR